VRALSSSKAASKRIYSFSRTCRCWCRGDGSQYSTSNSTNTNDAQSLRGFEGRDVDDTSGGRGGWWEVAVAVAVAVVGWCRVVGDGGWFVGRWVGVVGSKAA